MALEQSDRVSGTTRSPEKAAALRALGVTPVVVDVFDEDGLHRGAAELGWDPGFRIE